jgi:nucleotide-binding universal stress UspA family protein
MVFRSILVAIDGSETAWRALEAGAELAEALNAKLTVISVAPHVPPGAYRAGVDVPTLEHEVESEVDRLLSTAVDSLPGGLPVTVLHKHGGAGEAILKQLKHGDHDLLVMGSRGRGRVATNLFGSVAAHVFFHSRVPMLVIQPQDER